MGEQGKPLVRTYNQDENQQILDVFFSHGHTEIDTARLYAEGTTEPVEFHLILLLLTLYNMRQTLAKLDLKGAVLDTKLFQITFDSDTHLTTRQ